MASSLHHLAERTAGGAGELARASTVLLASVLVLVLFAVLVWLLSVKSPTALAVQATAQVDSSTVAFGAQVLGTTSPARPVVIGHSATSRSATIGSVAVSGPNAADFVPDASGCTNVTVEGSRTCTVWLRFSPSATGLRRATLAIQGVGTNRVVTAALSGTGQVPPLVATPPAVDFGTVGLGATSVTRAVSLTNSTPEPLVLASVALAGVDIGDFSITATPGGCSATTVVPGGACTVTVDFTPSAPGTRSASLVATYAHASRPLYVPLVGLGAQLQVEVNPATPNVYQHHSFGDHVVGTASAALPVNLTAPGTSVSLGAVGLAGPDASQFTLTSNGCTGMTLAPQASCTVTVAFVPTTQGVARASLAIVRTNESTPVDVVQFDGFGIVPKVHTRAKRAAFAAVRFRLAT